MRKTAYLAVGLIVALALFHPRRQGALGAPGQDAAWPAPAIRARRLAIVTGRTSTGSELKAAAIFQSRILKRSSVRVHTASESDAEAAKLIQAADVVFVVGSPDGNELAGRLLEETGVKLPALPNSDKLHPEGFAVGSGVYEGKPCVVIVGVDQRGTLYGAGWVLRELTYEEDAVLVARMEASERPAFWIRGGNPTGAGSRARQYGKLRSQTGEEYTERMEDLMLLGTNVFGGNPEVIRSYGMMTTTGRTANEMPAGSFPLTWAANAGFSRKYVCPSVPEARKALLESFEKQFKDSPDYDFFTTNSGDVGGCRCPRCMPWGGTYIRLMHEIADILHKYHPNTRILATNQDLTNEGNQAIFDYLNSRDSSWLYAIRYGPGADEMQTYIRGPVNPRWFIYEGFGPLGNYLKHMHHELPRTTNIALYTDITHWMQSQFGVPHPDVVLAAVYSRRSWNARPRHFHRVAQEILHYSVGDMHYSEGMHDDFNKWLWYRMLWNPHQEAEAVTRQYCRYWFGPDAQDDAAKAIFLMEETLEKPVIDNPGVRKAVELLRGARARIPPNLLKTDYRWRIITQKALMDLYIQLALQRGRELKAEAAVLLDAAVQSPTPERQAMEALRVLDRPLETDEMKRVRAEATALGEESNRIIGYRVPAVFIVESLDLTEVGWWKQNLQRGLATRSRTAIRNAAVMTAHYEDAGQGGFYDNVGWPAKSARLAHGRTIWGFAPMPGPAKHSHYSLAYSVAAPWEEDYKGVSFEYEGLEPQAQYVVRVSLGINMEEHEIPFAARGATLAAALVADGLPVGEQFSFPLGEVKYYEYDVPRQATADGKVEISMESRCKVLLFPLSATALSEIWLMRKDKMPWSAHSQ